MKAICPRCNGSRTVPRTKEEDGTEADPDIHPITSKVPKVCPRCGGEGKVVLTTTELAEKLKT